MTVYFGIKYHPDGSNRPLIESIAAQIEAYGHSVTCVFRDLENWGETKFQPNELMARTFDIIDRSNLVVIDLSEKGVGLGIEAGYACAKVIKVLTLAVEGSDISETLSGISSDVILYKDETDLRAKLEKHLVLG